MRVEQLLTLLPACVLEDLALQTSVNRYAKKLRGQVIFKLLLHCLLTQKTSSLRGMESAYETLFFRLLNQGTHKQKVAISSISERLSTIRAEYFERLYQHCVKVYKRQLGKHKEALIRFDSTIVSLSTKLLQIGYHLKGGDAQNYRQLKFTIGYSNGIAETVQFFTDQAHNSENLALRETVLQHAAANPSTSIRVFDMGVTARNTYDKLTDEGIVFVSLLHPAAKHDKIEQQHTHTAMPTQMAAAASMQILEDAWCQLYGQNTKAKYLVRRIEVRRLQDSAIMVFITNTADLSAMEVAEVYRSRWDIEVFFRFIKQLLHFNHLMNRSDNGIRVVLYVTMIAAVLLEAYKRSNAMSGYKIPMLKMSMELEEQIVKHLITMCGGNPDKLYNLSVNSP